MTLPPLTETKSARRQNTVITAIAIFVLVLSSYVWGYLLRARIQPEVYVRFPNTDTLEFFQVKKCKDDFGVWLWAPLARFESLFRELPIELRPHDTISFGRYRHDLVLPAGIDIEELKGSLKRIK